MNGLTEVDAVAEVDGATEVDAVVVGAGIAGLTAAYELTLAGLRPVVVEARGYPGGLLAEAEIAGLRVDIGAEAWAVRRPEVGELVAELGLSAEGPRGESWVHLPDGRAVRIPARAMLGVPQDPTDPDVVEALGAEGAARAAKDLSAPLPAADAERLGAGDLATLVRERMGDAVLDTLVRPIAGGIHGADPAQLSVGAVLPGLPAVLTREGSLGRAVAAVRARAPQGPAVASVEGTMASLPAALARRVREAGGEVRTRTGAQSLARAGVGDGTRETTQPRPTPAGPTALDTTPAAAGGAWDVVVAPTRPAPDPSAEPVPDGAGTVLRTRRVVLAGGPRATQRLVGGVATGPLPDLELTAGTPLTHLTMVLDCEALDAAPRGSGLLVAPECTDVEAKALTHLTQKWPSLGRAAARLDPGAHLHALRLSYGRAGRAMPDVDLDLALADASHLLGVELDAAAVRGHRLIRWGGALAPATPWARATSVAYDRHVAEDPTFAGIRLAGAWVAGTGLAAIVPHARDAARAVA